MKNARHESATIGSPGAGRIFKLLKIAVQPESIENRIWSKLQGQLPVTTTFGSPTTLLGQLECLIQSNALCDVLQALAACCDARAALLGGDMFWSRVAVLVKRAVPVSMKLRSSAPP